MTGRLPAAALLLAGALAAAAPASGPERQLLELTLPELTDADPGVAAQLAEAREAIAELAAEPGVAAADLAGAWGYLGQLLTVYDLAGSARIAFENAVRLAGEDRRWIYYRGVTEQQLSRLEEAAASFERTLALAPDDLPALLRLGQVELALQRRERAARRFARALELDPGNPAALYGSGRLLYLQERWAEAARSFEAVLARQPDAATAHYQLGLAYRELGELERARAHLARAGREDVRFADPLMERLGSLARGAAILVVQATRARARGDLDDAVAFFRAALETDPELESARLALAATLGEAGRPEEAVAELEEVLRRDPESAAALYNLGTLLAGRGESERAIELLRRSTESAPRFADAWVNLGGQLATVGRFEEAERALAEAVSLDPSDHPARLMHAESLARLARWEEALAEVGEVLQREPGSQAAAEAQRSLLLRAARAAGTGGDFARAAELYRQTLALDPDDREAGYGRAVALLLARDYAAALAHLEAGVRRRPEDLQLRTALARLLAACPDAEIRDGDRALRLARELVERELRIEHAATAAMALAELGRFDEASAVQERVVEQAERIGDAAAAARLRRHLELYRSGRKVREPWLE